MAVVDEVPLLEAPPAAVCVVRGAAECETGPLLSRCATHVGGGTRGCGRGVRLYVWPACLRGVGGTASGGGGGALVHRPLQPSPHTHTPSPSC